MTYNPLDSDDVLHQAGTFGQPNLNFAFEQPPHTETSTTGGGSVSFDADGALVNAGSTSGDTAEIGGVHIPQTNTWAKLFVTEIIAYSFAQTLRKDDLMKIGQVSQPGAGQQDGAYVDLTNQQVVVVGNTSPISVDDTDMYAPLYVRIELDDDVNETRFFISDQNNGVQTVTINSTPGDLRQRLLTVESNGNADELSLIAARHAVVPRYNQ